MTQTTTKPKRTRRPIRYGIALPHLQAWREYRIMDKKMLATAAGISGQSITNYEENLMNARVKVIHRLAAALGITPEQLVNEEPPIPARKGA